MAKKGEFFEVDIFTKIDFTDNRIVSFIEQNPQFSFDEYSQFLKSICIENENSKSIIDFLINYKDGCLCPEKCDAYEPITEIFDLNDIREPIEWLSQPGSAFYFKRNTTNCKHDGCIENLRFSPMWEGKKATTLMKSNARLPKLLGEIRFWFNKRDLLKNNKDEQFIIQLIKDLDKIIKIEKYSIS
jgi:hypothetical protein